MTHEQWMRKAMILLIASIAEQMNGRNPAFKETIRVLNELQKSEEDIKEKEQQK